MYNRTGDDRTIFTDQRDPQTMIQHHRPHALLFGVLKVFYSHFCFILKSLICEYSVPLQSLSFADQYSNISYIVHAIAEINGKLDQLFNYLTQSTATGPFKLQRPPLSSPPRSPPPICAPPLQTQTSIPPAQELPSIPLSRTPTPELWPQPLYNLPPPMRHIVPS